MPRPLYEVAADIKKHWKPVSPYAQPYLDAISCLDSIDENYGLDSGTSMVLYFLSNAQTWRGEDARRIKKELNDMVKEAK